MSATTKLGILSKNVFVYNYQVRKLNYSRQEIIVIQYLGYNTIKEKLIIPINNDINQQKIQQDSGLLIHYLKSNGCDVIYFNSFDNFDLSTTQLKFDDDNRSWFKWLEKNHGERSKNFQQYIHSPDGWYGSDNAHPGIKSHKKIADDLYEVIKTL